MIRRGDVYQLGAPDPTKGWEKQPPLAYVCSVGPNSAVVLLDGNVTTCSLAVLTAERNRGNVTEADLLRMLRKRVK